jgi:hypothetical protein
MEQRRSKNAKQKHHNFKMNQNKMKVEGFSP